MSEALTFWQGIAKMPEPAQQSFWEAGQDLSQHIGEPASPRRLQYDLSKPPPGMPWWEKLLFYAGQGQYNQAVGQSHQAEATLQGAKWLWGALQGDFNKNPTAGQIIVGGIISMIPLVDQACDVRDIVANCIVLSDEQARQDNENWIALGLCCIGFVPLFGSAIKTVAKLAMQKGSKLIDLLRRMEWFERSYQDLKAGLPWGHAPIAWLRSFDWISAARQAASHAKQAFESACAKAETAARYTIGAIQTKLLELAALFRQVAAKITDTLAEVGRRIKARVEEMLRTERQEAGNYGGSPGGAPNQHRQDELQPNAAAKLVRERRLEELATDPATGGKVTSKTRREAEVGLALEEQGKLPAPITRDPSGRAEFIDSTGQKWDVKGFNSRYAPKGYNTPDALEKIKKEIAANENVIIDTANMSPAHIAELRSAIAAEGLASRVIFF